MLDERAKSLLKTLVERYIADGQPVGSRTLSKASGRGLSPAPHRHLLADREELGLSVSPHTPAGRRPTPPCRPEGWRGRTLARTSTSRSR